MMKDLIWRVGNGRTIKIWEDPWLNSNHSNRVLSKVSILPPHSKVYDLMFTQPPFWNEELIRRILTNEESEKILGIPLAELIKKIN